jgi:methionine-R-sulfoxide reductase
MTEKIAKSESEWKQQLTQEQYHVAREAGTEPAFTGKYWKTKDAGTYHCVCCGEPLFDSTTKFNSGTGWPSFYQPTEKESTKIPAMEWFAPRHSVRSAVPIWVMCLRMARSRRGFVIA